MQDKKEIHQLHSLRHYKTKPEFAHYVGLQRLNEFAAKRKPQSHLN